MAWSSSGAFRDAMFVAQLIQCGGYRRTQKSDEPVWLDTLRPVRERPRLPVPEGGEIIDLDPEPLLSRLPSLPPVAILGPEHEIIDVDAEPSDPRSSPPPTAGPSYSNSPPPAAEATTRSEEDAQSTPPSEDDLQQLSLDFIQQCVALRAGI
jgi:hypothetical protein